MTRLKSMRLPLLVTVAVCLLMTGCGPENPDTVKPATDGPSSTATAAPDEKPRLLASLHRSGGMCPDGVCDWGIEVRTDGAYRAWEMQDSVRGQLTSADLATLDRALTTTDLEDNKKPDQLCNAWTDGMDVTIVYAPTAEDRTTVSTCDYDLAGDVAVIELDRLREEATSGTISAD